MRTLLLSTMALPFFLLVMGCQSGAQSDTLVHQGPYLGQETPGSIAKVFAPGTVSGNHRDIGAFFSPDMREFYFTRMDLDTEEWSLIGYTLEEGKWKPSISMPRIGRPTISPDGGIMHLGKRYIVRTAQGWSNAYSHGPIFDREDWGIMRLTSTADGTFVFDDYKNGDVIRISALEQGERQEPKVLGKEINTGRYNAHPFIAPDGSYLIWDGERESGFGGIDLWISFKQSDDNWGEAVNLGPGVNSAGRDANAFVTADGKYLFFSRISPETDGDIFWVDAQIIEDLRVKHTR